MDEIFKKLRFDESHHIGLGDIRLTIAQQHELAVIHNKLKLANESLEAENTTLKELIKSLLRHVGGCWCTTYGMKKGTCTVCKAKQFLKGESDG